MSVETVHDEAYWAHIREMFRLWKRKVRRRALRRKRLNEAAEPKPVVPPPAIPPATNKYKTRNLLLTFLDQESLVNRVIAGEQQSAVAKEHRITASTLRKIMAAYWCKIKTKWRKKNGIPTEEEAGSGAEGAGAGQG